MSFHITAPCFLTFYCSDQSLLPFYIQNFALNTSLFTFYATLCMIMHGYNMVKHSVTGTSNCTGASYCTALI